ncbi:MAG TPA: glycosyltransferase family 2 protein [Polyangiaceae bacterium]
MLLSVVIVNWNSREDLRVCLVSLWGQTHTHLEIIVVDNGSADGSPEMVAAEFPEVVLLRENENLGFAEGCNRGIEASHGAWVALLNNDAVAKPDWARALVDAIGDAPAECGMLQSLLLYQQTPDVINSTGIELTYSGGGRDRDGGTSINDAAPQRDIFCPTAGAAAYRRAMLESIRLPNGYFDRDHFMYYEDLDLGWRARLSGWSARYVPASIVLHRWHGSAARHGRPWLVVISCINRLRTLIKNASIWFIVRTSPRTILELTQLVWFGRSDAVMRVARAVRESAFLRSRVGTMARVPRRALEREWTADPC